MNEWIMKKRNKWMNKWILNLSQRTVSNGSFTFSRSFNPFMLCTYTVNKTVQYSTVQYSTVQMREEMTGGTNK